VFEQSFTNIKIENTTTDKIEKVMEKLQRKKSCGYDEIKKKF